MGKRNSKQRIAPLIEETAILGKLVKESRSRDSGNTLLSKEFPGGILVITGANSSVGLRSMPARFLFLDECDAYPGDVDGEGDPIALAETRTRTFRQRRKVLMTRGVPFLAPVIEHSERMLDQGSTLQGCGLTPRCAPLS
jgi:phage terminase large subunit GpA-like protein